MDLDNYTQRIKKKLKSIDKDINNFSEKEFQIHCADVLIDEGLKVFMEYPFPLNPKEECDVVITEKDCLNVNTWIELKPVWEYPHSNYWNYSKFIGEAPFKHDIHKLFNVSKKSKAWFVMILFSQEEKISDKFSKPQPRVRLTTNQIVGVVSKWANKNPNVIRTFQTSKNFCHIICWDVKDFKNIKD
ncbi:MAG: hypothetical protein KAQ83_01885 [Nanoarchaeota archaeon]|nr:hypothetical protein [Nanoarchaeota archaeon]